MSTKTFKIASYKVQLGRKLEMGGAGFYALISCIGSAGETLLVYFQRPDSIALGNAFFVDRKLGRIIVPAEQFPWYVDVLRNETPVYGYMNSEHPEWNSVRTSNEPIGEGES